MMNRFWSKVRKRKSTECWNWTAYVGTSGYGSFRSHSPRRPEYAHRVSWELTHGPIPDGMCVLHRCDNKLCQNPSHLFLGTRQENNQDRDRKGRSHHLIGEAHPHSRIAERDVIKIRSAYQSGKTISALAREYAYTRQGMDAIVSHKLWKHV